MTKKSSAVCNGWRTLGRLGMCEHSKLPWVAEDFEEDNGTEKMLVSTPTDPAGFSSIIVETLMDAEGRANCEFIVRACNAHYELLEALEAVWNDWSDRADDEDFEGYETLQKVKSAIEKGKP